MDLGVGVCTLEQVFCRGQKRYQFSGAGVTRDCEERLSTLSSYFLILIFLLFSWHLVEAVVSLLASLEVPVFLFPCPLKL